jgi:flagellar biosynthetic protein FlhB
MAEVDGQEKTEEPTAKKLEESRKKGQVAKSLEINSFAILTLGLFIIYLSRQALGGSLAKLAIKIFSSLDKLTLTPDLMQGYFKDGVLFYFGSLWPIFAGIIVVGLVATIGQVGLKFSPKALTPNFSKFNPLSGIKNLFFTTRSFIELSKSIVKLIIIALFTYYVIKDFILQATLLVEFSVSEIVQFMIEASFALVWKIALMFGLIAFADFAFQKYKHRNDMMMTKQEVKEENNQSEGNPQIKSKIRSVQMAAARKRMMQDVPKADVIITNPTHLSIALKYEMAKDAAPKVLAKGADEVALRIREIAKLHNIPLHEDKELARALFKLCDVGDFIPANLFKAVAQVLAYIYQLKNEKKKKKSIV